MKSSWAQIEMKVLPVVSQVLFRQSFKQLKQEEESDAAAVYTFLKEEGLLKKFGKMVLKLFFNRSRGDCGKLVPVKDQFISIQYIQHVIHLLIYQKLFRKNSDSLMLTYMGN